MKQFIVNSLYLTLFIPYVHANDICFIDTGRQLKVTLETARAQQTKIHDLRLPVTTGCATNGDNLRKLSYSVKQQEGSLNQRCRKNIYSLFSNIGYLRVSNEGD